VSVRRRDGRNIERVSLDFNDRWQDWDHPPTEFPQCEVCEGSGEGDSSGADCPACGGHGDIATDEERAAAEVPEGDAWQVWETVYGSPITPVFASAEELIEHLVAEGTGWDPPFRREAAEAFVREGWAPSLLETPEGMVMGSPKR